MRRRRITAATLKEAQGWLGLRPEVSRHRARSGISAKSPMYVNTSAVDRLAVKLASDEKNQPTQYVGHFFGYVPILNPVQGNRNSTKVGSI